MEKLGAEAQKRYTLNALRYMSMPAHVYRTVPEPLSAGSYGSPALDAPAPYHPTQLLLAVLGPQPSPGAEPPWSTQAPPDQR
eukprot:scaffold47199_cov28-Tisochrysis_lutea.AAC.2